MSFFLFNSVFHYFQFSHIKPFIPTGGVFVEIGCNNPPFTILKVMKTMDFCIGIDAKVENVIIQNYELKKCYLKKKIPIESELANVVVMTILDQLDHPLAIIKECYRILKPGGILLLTFSSFHRELGGLVGDAGFRTTRVSPFLFGLQLMTRAVK